MQSHLCILKDLCLTSLSGFFYLRHLWMYYEYGEKYENADETIGAEKAGFSFLVTVN